MGGCDCMWVSACGCGCLHLDMCTRVHAPLVATDIASPGAEVVNSHGVPDVDGGN